MTREAVSIKGTRNGLVILLDAEQEFNQLKLLLQNKLESAKGFFTGARFWFKQTLPRLSHDQQEELITICINNGLVPTSGGYDREIEPQAKKSFLPDQSCTGLTPEEETSPCLLIQQSIRSGQAVTFNGHVTVLGDLHPGGVITATGNILIMGSLRGVAHAGAMGDSKAIIIAYRLQPSQLRIAHMAARSPEHPANGPVMPEIARIINNSIVVEPYVAKNEPLAKFERLA
ncbi:MAG: septum site-determining protein MinC [Bacillota bacterium]